MKKFDKISYNQMIEKLQNHMHKAPDTWHEIEEEISFNQGISNLKEYKAPDDIWGKIESELDESLPKKSVHYNRFKFGAAIIIIVGLLLFLTHNYFQTKNKINAFVYSSEIEVTSNELPNVESNNEAYSSGIDFIDNNKSNFSEESFNSYQEQLLEIESALEKIKMMQEQYGEDASSLKMASKLEREKADLIKSMINRA